MPQPRQKKKRPRHRGDPQRQAAAERRDESRRLAADQRRQAQESVRRRRALRRRLTRIGLLALVAVAVLAIAFFAFRPSPPQLAGAETVAMVNMSDPATSLMGRLGYPITTEPDAAQLPSPACGVQTQWIASADELYSDYYNGAVVLLYRAGDSAAQAAVTDIARESTSRVVVAPNPAITVPVVATAWKTWMSFPEVNSVNLREFVNTYVGQAPGQAACTYVPPGS